MTEPVINNEIQHKGQLVEYFEKGCKPPEKWGIGTEHEKFLFQRSQLKRLDYESKYGIRSILKALQRDGWQPLFEKENIIGLRQEGASITLEPGGQFELSGANFTTIQETYDETKKHFEELNRICRKYDFFSLPMGVDPISSREDLSWMPKERYRWMRQHMPRKGNLGLEMMTNSASIQVNLDFSSEKDMVKKLRVSQALQPIITAIFANSPFSGGKPCGFLSYRAHIWDHTDPNRCGFLPFIFDKGFGFERWVDYLLDVPMYFIAHQGDYFPAHGMTFGQFFEGKHTAAPTMEDWETHVSTVFPDVRLKQFIEMRGADASCLPYIAALSAFWVGLLYDSDSLEEAHQLVSGWDVQTLQELRSRVPEKGLHAASGNLDAGNISVEVYRLAIEGLARRAKIWGIEDESRFLEPVREIIESRTTQAERFLQYYRERSSGDIKDIIYSWQKTHLQCCSGDELEKTPGES